MHRVFTPLLRRVYLCFGVFVAIYIGILVGQYSSWNKERLYRQLLGGNEKEQASAGFDLAYLNGETQLIRALKVASPNARMVAINSLWDLWLRAGGHRAFRRVQTANQAIARKAYPEALQILTEVTERYPAYPEGWNRRATLLWELGRYQEAITDAKRVVTMNPNHFGAWQGMGLCHVHLGELEEACRCMRAALRITPHDEKLRQTLERCEEMLHRLPPSERTHLDLI